jgi:hypothetical protein
VCCFQVELARTPSSFSLSEMDRDDDEQAAGAMAALAAATGMHKRTTRQHNKADLREDVRDEEETEDDEPELEDPSPMPRPSKKARTGWSRGMPVREQQPCPDRGRGLRVPNRCFLSHHTRLSPPSTTGVDCLSHSFSVCRRCHPRRRHPPRRRRRCRRPSDLRGRRR